MSPNIVIFGATSAMAEAAARLWAARKARLFLVARNAEKLELVARNLRDLGAEVVATRVADLLDTAGHAELVRAAAGALGRLDIVLVAHGTLGDQKAGEADFAVAEREIRSNFLSPASLCTLVANDMERQGGGTLAVIGSVAGDRGRQSNYIYGSAKGGLALFLQGLRNRLAHRGVAVVTLLPGFVDTPMTAGVAKGPLFATAARAGACIVSAIHARKNVAYVPGFWRLIMFIIRSIPEGVFKKLKL